MTKDCVFCNWDFLYCNIDGFRSCIWSAMAQALHWVILSKWVLSKLAVCKKELDYNRWQHLQ